MPLDIMPKRFAVLAAGSLLAVAAAGCGSSDSGSSSSAASSAPAASASTAAPSSSTATSKPAASSSAKSGNVALTIKGYAYQPKTVTVKVGAKLTWTNKDQTNHTVTFTSGVKKDLGNQPPGTKKTMTFTKAGTYKYVCDYHPFMHGTVVVR